MMKRPIGYKLSPNEEARLLKETREALRKQRLIQVREQAKDNAAKIRDSVKAETKRQFHKLSKQIVNEWNKERDEKLCTLEELYKHSISHVGESHGSALQEESKEDNSALVAEVDQRRAVTRYENALQKLRIDEARQKEEQEMPIVARQKALEVEKSRAMEVAAKPPPPPDPLLEIEVPKVHPVKFTDLTAFSSTHYHIPELCYVEKAEPHEQVNAREFAELESDKLIEAGKDQKRSLLEQREKAQLRYQHAIKKEILKHDYANMLHDLSDLQRSDMHRRQLVVDKIPKQIFVPPHRHLEEKEETQRDMEGAFEDMYMNATEFQGDLSLALDPHPPPETPTHTESLDLSVLDPDTTITEDNQETVLQPQPPSHWNSTNRSQSSTADRQKTPDGLSRLMGRIRAQRSQWVQQAVPGGVDEDLPAKPSPASASKAASEEPQISEHPMTDSSPSNVPETASLSTGELSSTHETQSTVTSGSSTGQGSETMTATTTETGSTQATSQGDDYPSVTYPRHINFRNDNQMMLHPMEQAARIRDVPNNGDLSAYLRREKLRQAETQAQWQQEAALIQQETLQSQQQLQYQKILLEEKLRNIEKQRSMLVTKLNTSTRPGGLDSTGSDQYSVSSMVWPEVNQMTQPRSHPAHPGQGQSEVSGLPKVSGPSDLQKSRLEQDYHQPLANNTQFQELSHSRQQMADRAHALLHVTNNILKKTPPVCATNVGFQSPDGVLSEHTMTSSSGRSRDRVSVDAYTRQILSGNPNDNEHQSSLPPFGDLEFRFDALENRLRQAEIVLAPPSGSPGNHVMSESDEKDSFDLRQEELQGKLAVEENRKPSVYTRESVQRGQLEKPEWFVMLPDSAGSQRQHKPLTLQQDEDLGYGAATKPPIGQMRRHLSLGESLPSDSVVEVDGATRRLASDGIRRGNELLPFPHDRLQRNVDVAAKKELPHVLYHTQEMINSGPRSIDFCESSWYSRERSQPPTQANGGLPMSTDLADRVAGRTWHLELLECSTESDSSSQKSHPSRLAAHAESEPDPLVFEIAGPESPPLLRRVGREQTLQQFSSTPVKEGDSSDQPKQSDIGEDHVRSEYSGVTPTSGSEGHSVSHSRDNYSDLGVKRLSQQGLETTNNTTGQFQHSLSQYSMSNGSSLKWSSPLSELSQYPMGESLDYSQHPISTSSILSNQDAGNLQHPFLSAPLKSIPESSHQAQAIGVTDRHRSNEGEESKVSLFGGKSGEVVDHVNDVIAKRVEESLGWHHMLSQGHDQAVHRGGTENDDLNREQAGISDQSQISLVSLDSTLEEQTDLCITATAEDQTASMATNPVSKETTVYTMATTVDPLTATSGTAPAIDPGSQTNRAVDDAGQMLGSGARPKEVKFEGQDGDTAGLFMSLKPDTEDLEQAQSDRDPARLF